MKKRVFIVAFNESGNLNLYFIPTIEQIQNNLKRSEPTSLYDAIYLAADKLRESKNLKCALLIISDSADHKSRHSFSDLNKQLKAFEVQIYAVIFDESNVWSLVFGNLLGNLINFSFDKPLIRRISICCQ